MDTINIEVVYEEVRNVLIEVQYLTPGGQTGGGITSISSANDDIVITNPTTTPVLTLKAIPTAVGTALALKADKTYVDTQDSALSTAIGLKADSSAVNTALALKADTSALTSGLASKADATATTSALALKADTSTVNSALALKADSSTTTAALATKVDKTITVNGQPLSANVTLTKSDVGLNLVDNTADINKVVSNPTQTALNLKADTTALTAGLATKADDAATTAALALKANLASPTFTGTVTMPTPFTLGATSVTTTGTRLNMLTSAAGTTGSLTSSLVFSNNPAFILPRLTAYTVATLPAAPGNYALAVVTDALSPTYGAALTGGGTVVTTVFYTGTAWRAC